MSDVTSFKVTGDWRHIVDDGMVDGDNLPDEVPLTGKVVFKPVYPTVATAGVPVTAYTLGPVTALVAGGVLTDLQGRPGVMLAGKVGEHAVRWSAETSLRFQEQKVDYPRVTFELTKDVRLTGIITQVGPSLSPIVVDPRIEALAASVDSVDQAVTAASGYASDAAEAVTLAGQEADRAIGLAGAQDEHIAGTLEDPESATHAAFKAVGNATYADKAQFTVTPGGTKAGTGSGGATAPNIVLGGTINNSGIDSGQMASVLLQPGSPGFNNVIGGNGAATVGTPTPNVIDPAIGNVGVSLIGGYDNVAGSLSSKIISDHSYTEPGGNGHNAIYGGANHVARSTAAFAIIAGGSKNEVAGQYAFATGFTNKALGSSSRVSGSNNTVSGLGSVADGTYNTASGDYAAAVGNRNIAASNFSSVYGQYGISRDFYQQAVGGGRWTRGGDRQTSMFLLSRKTINATPYQLGFGGGTDGPRIPEGFVFAFTALVVGVAEDGTDSAAFRVEGIIRRGVGDATATVVGTTTVAALGADAGASTWGLGSVTGANAQLRIFMRGEVARIVRWVGRVTTTEVGALTTAA